jgi:hypothetical protein
MRIPDPIVEMLARRGEGHVVTLTTLGREGWPHARPMDLVAVTPDGEGLLFGSVNAGETADNLRKDRRAAVAVARHAPREGYGLEGWAEYVDRPDAPEVAAAKALDPGRPVVGAFLFHVQRVRVATPLAEETGQFLPGGQPRQPPPYRPIDFDVVG